MKLASTLTYLVVGMAASATGTAMAQTTAPPAVLVLLDSSGSMTVDMVCPGLGTVPRWRCAAKIMEEWIVKNDTDLEKPYEYSFWQLRYDWENGSMVEKDSAKYGKAHMIQRLGFATTPDPSGPEPYPGAILGKATPLAEVACDALDALPKMYTDPQKPLILKLGTDGGENVPELTQEICNDPSSPTVFFPKPGRTSPWDLSFEPPDGLPVLVKVNQLTVPSWESNLLAMAVSGQLGYYRKDQLEAFLPPDPDKGPRVQTFIDTLYDWSVSPSSVRASTTDASLEGGPVVRASAPSSVAASTDLDPEFVFLQGLAEATGGRLVQHGTVNLGSPAFGHLIPGDVNDSGCVDDVDLEALLAVFGQHIDSTNPATYQADVTYDALVDVRDYKLVAANWGSGCASPPPPAPLPMEVLFGFEDASSWSSSQTPLSNRTSPVSGGTYALAVDGKGWRGVQTAPFSTEILHGVTGKIAYDVYVPAQQSNKYWHGQTMMFVTCPSARLFNFPVGLADLSWKPVGSYSTIQFYLPRFVKMAMETPHSDFSIKIVINAFDPGYLLDSLRFVP